MSDILFVLKLVMLPTLAILPIVAGLTMLVTLALGTFTHWRHTTRSVTVGSLAIPAAMALLGLVALLAAPDGPMPGDATVMAFCAIAVIVLLTLPVAFLASTATVLWHQHRQSAVPVGSTL